MQNSNGSYSPGVHKLVHHLDHLKSILTGKCIAPIHVSVWPTLRCQCHCSYCCCRNTSKKDVEDLNVDSFRNAVDVLAKYGTKAIEFSGGGEPLLWGPLSEMIAYIHNKGIKVSLISNGLELKNISQEILSLFSWIRISLQSLQHAESVDFEHARRRTRISASYIVANERNDFSIIRQLYDFANKRDMIVRVAIQRPSSEGREREIGDIVENLGAPLFFSRKTPGTPLGCYMAWIRAAIDWQGRFLPCPALQLNLNSEGKIPEGAQLCHIDHLEEWILSTPPKDLGYRCEFCNCGKDHNDFIHSCLKGIEDAEFV